MLELTKAIHNCMDPSTAPKKNLDNFQVKDINQSIVENDEHVLNAFGGDSSAFFTVTSKTKRVHLIEWYFQQSPEKRNKLKSKPQKN